MRFPEDISTSVEMYHAVRHDPENVHTLCYKFTNVSDAVMFIVDVICTSPDVQTGELESAVKQMHEWITKIMTYDRIGGETIPYGTIPCGEVTFVLRLLEMRRKDIYMVSIVRTATN